MDCVLNEFNEVVNDSLEGERLDRLISFIGNISRSEASTLIRDNGVFVNGETVTRPSFKVAVGNQIKFSTRESEINQEIEADSTIDFTVIHTDPDFFVLDKPAGLVVHPGAGNLSGTLVNGLLSMSPQIREVGERTRPGIVHRLDKGTSGLLIAANTDHAYQFFVDQLSKHKVKRIYQALVWGIPEGPEGIVDAPIGRSSKNRKKMAIVANGKTAKTIYVMNKSWNTSKVSLLEVELETGRTHQIRVHLSSIGNPVVGDEIYGGNRKSFTLRRQFLHAHKLRFEHPRDGSVCEFESPLPKELKDVLVTLDEVENG
jgi:23S rRNA pseudouridine1911/1915/1917 synthase